MSLDANTPPREPYGLEDLEDLVLDYGSRPETLARKGWAESFRQGAHAAYQMIMDIPSQERTGYHLAETFLKENPQAPPLIRNFVNKVRDYCQSFDPTADSLVILPPSHQLHMRRIVQLYGLLVTRSKPEDASGSQHEQDPQTMDEV